MPRADQLGGSMGSPYDNAFSWSLFCGVAVNCLPVPSLPPSLPTTGALHLPSQQRLAATLSPASSTYITIANNRPRVSHSLSSSLLYLCLMGSCCSSGFRGSALWVANYETGILWCLAFLSAMETRKVVNHLCHTASGSW